MTFTGIEQSIRPIVVGLTAVASIIGDAAKAFDGLVTRALGRLRSFLGMPAPINGSSTGAAVRNVGFSNSEAYHNKLITTAFGLGTASTEDKMASDVLSIKTFLLSLPGRMWDAFKAMPGAIAVEFLQFIEGLIERIKPLIPGQETAKEIGNAARDASRWLDDKRKQANDVANRLGVGGLIP